MTDLRGYIDISGLDPRKIVAAAFEHSRPQGLGFMHHEPGPITDEEIDAGIMRPGRYSYDYVRGRSMKLHFDQHGDKLYWWCGWYDHSAAAQKAVLVEAGMAETDAATAMAKAEAEIVARNAE